MSNARVTKQYVEVALQEESAARVTKQYVEVALQEESAARVTKQYVEVGYIDIVLGQSTDEPTNVIAESATLNGSISDLEGPTEVDAYFEWGLDTNYGNTTTPETLTSPGSFSADIDSLTTLQNYHYRAVVTDGVVTWYGDDVRFAPADFSYRETEGSDFETGELDDVEVVDGKLQLIQFCALVLNGSDAWVDLEVTSADFGIDGANPRTIICRVYTEDFNSGAIWHFGEHGSNQKDFALRTLDSDNEWRLQIWGSDLDFTYDSLNKWVEFKVVYDGSTVEMFADGNSQGTLNVTLDTSTNLTARFGQWSDRGYYFKGKIDYVDIYDDETATNLTGSYYFNQAPDDTAYDESGNDYHGTIYNAEYEVLGVEASNGTRTTPEIDISTLESVEDSVVQWTSTEPTDTSITIEAAISEDGGSTWDSWQTCTDEDVVPGLADADLSDARVKFRQILETTDGAETPELEAFEFYIAELRNIPQNLQTTNITKTSARFEWDAVEDT